MTANEVETKEKTKEQFEDNYVWIPNKNTMNKILNAKPGQAFKSNTGEFIYIQWVIMRMTKDLSFYLYN